ncbi:MAG TPA: hypothetical protein DIS96_03795 [Pusillimonas sp.]|nr:hypothetical protein [Pusillimonas sp.]
MSTAKTNSTTTRPQQEVRTEVRNPQGANPQAEVAAKKAAVKRLRESVTRNSPNRFQLEIDTVFRFTLRNLENMHKALMEETIQAEETSYICDAMSLVEIGQELVQQMSAIKYDDYDHFAGEFSKADALFRAIRRVYGERDSYASRVLTGLVESVGVMFELVEFVELEDAARTERGVR